MKMRIEVSYWPEMDEFGVAKGRARGPDIATLEGPAKEVRDQAHGVLDMYLREHPGGAAVKKIEFDLMP